MRDGEASGAEAHPVHGWWRALVSETKPGSEQRLAARSIDPPQRCSRGQQLRYQNRGEFIVAQAPEDATRSQVRNQKLVLQQNAILPSAHGPQEHATEPDPPQIDPELVELG